MDCDLIQMHQINDSNDAHIQGRYTISSEFNEFA